MKLFTSRTFIATIIGALTISISAMAEGNKAMHRNMDKNADKEYSQRFEPDSQRAQMNTNKTTIKAAQRNLNNNGYNLAVDGIVGPNTRKAIRGFQADRGIAETGKLDMNTLQALNVDANQFDRAPAGVDEDTADWYDEDTETYRDRPEDINDPSM